MTPSFAKFMKMQEAVGFGLSTPAAEKAVTKILWSLHGAMPDELMAMARLLQSPKGIAWVTKMVGGPTHDSGDAVHEVITTVLREIGAYDGI